MPSRRAARRPREAERALRLVRTCLGDGLVGLYLHGSAVAGGLRPRSDVDLLVVAGRPMMPGTRRRLLCGLMRLSGRADGPDGARPLDVAVLRLDDPAAAAYPRRCEFIYGEWLRADCEAGAVPGRGAEPELSVLLAQARRRAVRLFGPVPRAVLPVVPAGELRRAIRDLLPGLVATLEGDERNVLLTLARMWRTLTTGEIVPKDVAADWAIPRLPGEAAGILRLARDGYLGAGDGGWRGDRRASRRAAGLIADRVVALLPPAASGRDNDAGRVGSGRSGSSW